MEDGGRRSIVVVLSPSPFDGLLRDRTLRFSRLGISPPLSRSLESLGEREECAGDNANSSDSPRIEPTCQLCRGFFSSRKPKLKHKRKKGGGGGKKLFFLLPSSYFFSSSLAYLMQSRWDARLSGWKRLWLTERFHYLQVGLPKVPSSPLATRGRAALLFEDGEYYLESPCPSLAPLPRPSFG